MATPEGLFREMLNDIREALGSRRGWKTQAARMLNIDASVISRALAKKSPWKLSPGVAERVAASAGLDHLWFFSSGASGPWWQEASLTLLLEPSGLRLQELREVAIRVAGLVTTERIGVHEGRLLFDAWEQCVPGARFLRYGVKAPDTLLGFARETLAFVDAVENGAEKQVALDARAEFLEVMGPRIAALRAGVQET